MEKKKFANKNQYDVIEYVLVNYDYKSKEDLIDVVKKMMAVAMKNQEVDPSLVSAFSDAINTLSNLDLEDINNIKAYINEDDGDDN